MPEAGDFDVEGYAGAGLGHFVVWSPVRVDTDAPEVVRAEAAERVREVSPSRRRWTSDQDSVIGVNRIVICQHWAVVDPLERLSRR